MVCPNCGAALEDFDVFCPGCGKTIQKDPDGTLTAIDPQPAADPVEAPPKKVAKRLYPPEEAETPPTAEPSPAEAPEAAPEPPVPDSETPTAAKSDSPPEKQPDVKANDPGKKRLLILAVVLGLVAIAAVAAAVSFYLKTDGLRVQAQKAQMENAAAQATLEDTQDQLTSLQSKYDTALADNDQLSSQVEDLSGQIRDMKSSVSQSEYDKATAQKELEDAQDQLTALQSKYDTALADNDDLSSQVEDLSGQIRDMKTSVSQSEYDNAAARSCKKDHGMVECPGRIPFCNHSDRYFGRSSVSGYDVGCQKRKTDCG